MSEEVWTEDEARANVPPRWFRTLLTEIGRAENRTDWPLVVYRHDPTIVTGHFNYWPEAEIDFTGPREETPHARQIAIHEIAHWIVGPIARVTIGVDGIPTDVYHEWHGEAFYRAAWRLYQRHGSAVIDRALRFEIGYQGRIAADTAAAAGLFTEDDHADS